MGARALDFSRAHPDASPGYTAAMTRLEERLARGEQLASQQREGLLEVRAATARKMELRRAMRQAHLSHLAELHEAGHLLAAGPLSDERFRGLSILNVGAERARELAEQDPAVRAGRFSVEVIPWLVPGGAISVAPTRFPRSMAEADPR